MPSVFSKRFTTEIEGPFVVFLIGMRINKVSAVRKWLPAAQAMPRMLKVLREHPEKGCLSSETFFRFPPLQTILVSYWRSFDHLERFARNTDDPHLAAWHEFNRKVGSDGTVGIWHETYRVEAGSYETFYNNMPAFGLAAATGNILPALGRRNSARERMAMAQESPIVEGA